MIVGELLLVRERVLNLTHGKNLGRESGRGTGQTVLDHGATRGLTQGVGSATFMEENNTDSITSSADRASCSTCTSKPKYRDRDIGMYKPWSLEYRL